MSEFEKLDRQAKASAAAADRQDSGKYISGLAASGVDVPDYYSAQVADERNTRSQALADADRRAQFLAQNPNAGYDWQEEVGPEFTGGEMMSYAPGNSPPPPEFKSVPYAAGPEQAQDAQPEVPTIEQFMADSMQSYRNRATMHTESIQRLREYAKQTADQVAYLQGLQEKGEIGAREDLQRAQAAYSQAMNDLDSIRIDPNQWEQAAPTLTKVLMTIASGIAGFAGGRGPNPVVQLVERAIDRDVQAQMVRADSIVKKSNMGVEAANVQAKLGATLRAATYQRALGALDQIMKHAQTEEAVFNAAMAREELAPLAAREALSQMLLYRKLSGAGAGHGTPLSPKFVQEYAQRTSGLAEGERLMTSLAQLIKDGDGMTPITRSGVYTKLADIFDFSTTAGDIDAKVKSFATRMARATGVDKGNFAQEETKRFIEAVMGKRWDAAKTALASIMDTASDAVMADIRTKRGLAAQDTDTRAIEEMAAAQMQSIMRMQAIKDMVLNPEEN